jgi:hypothetical protein
MDFEKNAHEASVRLQLAVNRGIEGSDGAAQPGHGLLKCPVVGDAERIDQAPLFLVLIL